MTKTIAPASYVVALMAFSAGLSGSIPDAHSQVVPDGTTTTSVAADASGVSTVSIAPASLSGLSHNTYEEFSVPAAGVNLDNRSVVARTILNEVTSSRISNLNGPLEVLGASAHVILANPNGITVNGGSFVNTGGVVLSTGVPSIVTHTAPGISQDNVVLETSSGRIDVTGAGLSGAMTSLQMLAGEIRIDGPVENTSSNVRAEIRLHAGSTRVEYDSAVLATADLETWGDVTEVAGITNGPAVEITRRGSLKANTVRIHATNDGAGVSHAGAGLASSGDFVIDAQGKLSLAGSIKAARHVSIKADEVEARSAASERQSTVEAVSGALTIIARTGDIINTGTLMSGAARDADDADSKGGATLQAAGDIQLLTERPEQLAIVFSSGDELSVTAGGTVSNNTGRLLSNGQTRIEAGGDILNMIDVVAGASPAGKWAYTEQRGKRLWYTLWQKRQITTSASVDYGKTRVAGQQAYIVGSDVTLNAGGRVANLGGSINANGDAAGLGGIVSIDADLIENRSIATGSLSFSQTCELVCVGYGTSDIAVAGGGINGFGDVTLTAADQIINGGQITSYAGMRLVAPRVLLEGTRIASVYTRPSGLYNFWRGSSVWMGEVDQGGILIAPAGSMTIDAFTPVVVNAGALDARDGVRAVNGIDLVAPPVFGVTTGQHSVGLFGHLVGD